MTIIVHGTPAPQGSKRHVGRGVMIESSKKVKPWREAVKWAALAPDDVTLRPHEKLIGPVRVHVTFYMPKPKSAKKNAVPDKKPDIDKLIRSTFDALTEAGIWEDDSRVTYLSACKEYAEQRAPGALITVTKWGEI